MDNTQKVIQLRKVIYSSLIKLVSKKCILLDFAKCLAYTNRDSIRRMVSEGHVAAEHGQKKLRSHTAEGVAALIYFAHESGPWARVM